MSMLNKAIRKSLLIGLLTLVAAPMGAYADPPGDRVRRGYRLTGTIYSHFIANQNDCKRSCDVSPHCRAWNYDAINEPSGRCYMLSNPGRLGYRDGWVSGIKPPPPAVKASREQPPPPPVVQR